MIEDTMFDNDCYAVFMEEEHEKEKRVRDNISRQAAIDEIRKCRFVVDAIEKIRGLPSAEPKTDDENELKFYYVESIDDYWIGQRLDNFYYADWHECLGFVWSKSRYLPWGEHIVDENTLWKEHTYPSEPIEIPFTEWIVGFMKKYSAEPKTGEWIDIDNYYRMATCSHCLKVTMFEKWGEYTRPYNYCPNCGAKMVREEGEEE